MATDFEDIRNALIENLFVGQLNSTGGRTLSVTGVSSATYSILKSDYIIAVDTTSNNVVATLPAVISGLPSAGGDDGRVFLVKKLDQDLNHLTIEPQGGSTINGETTNIIMGIKEDSIELIAFNGDWHKVTRSTGAFGLLTVDTPGGIQALTTTPVICNAFDTVRFSTPGIVTGDVAADTLTVDHAELDSLGGDGYRIDFRLEIDYQSNNQELRAQIFINGVATTIEDVRQTSNAFNTVLQASDVIRLNAADVVDLRLTATNSANADYRNGDFLVERLTK